MKLFNLSFFALSLVIGTSSLIWAADAPKNINNHQSPFDGYKALSDDNLSDWKSINVPPSDAGHAEHSMAGMQHNMTSEQKINMPSDSKEMSVMEGMNHSSMADMDKVISGKKEGMDHNQMKHDNTMSPNAGMNQSKMTGMNQDRVKPDYDSNSLMQPMKKEALPTIDQNEMAGHNHGGSDMKSMDYSKITDSKPSDMQPTQNGAVQDESQPQEHASEVGLEYAGMAKHSNEPTAQLTSWQIIPNFHPAVVHFPIALTIIAFLLSLSSYVSPNHPRALKLAAAGHFTLWLAAIGAIAAVLFGWLAFNSISNHDYAGHAAMLLHRAWAIPTAIGLILTASWDVWKYRSNQLMPVPMLFIILLLSQSIAVTGWLGGEVVYRHGIGVISIPSSDDTGHDHGQHDGVADTPKKLSGTSTKMNIDEKGESHEH